MPKSVRSTFKRNLLNIHPSINENVISRVIKFVDYNNGVLPNPESVNIFYAQDLDIYLTFTFKGEVDGVMETFTCVIEYRDVPIHKRGEIKLWLNMNGDPTRSSNVHANEMSFGYVYQDSLECLFESKEHVNVLFNTTDLFKDIVKTKVSFQST